VNPPGPKPRFWTNDEHPENPDLWKSDAKLVNDTWWNDWAEWIDERGGDQVPAPDHLGSEAYPVLDAAPGTYVRVRA